MATRLGSKVRYPDGVCRALVAPERISEIPLQAARHVYPAGCGATGESERATNEVGIWSRSQAEITSVPMLGLLSSLCTVAPNDGAGDHAVALQYASEGSRALLFSTMARVHTAFADLFSHLAARPYDEGYGALGRDKGGWGWCMLAARSRDNRRAPTRALTTSAGDGASPSAADDGADATSAPAAASSQAASGPSAQPASAPLAAGAPPPASGGQRTPPCGHQLAAPPARGPASAAAAAAV